MLGSVLINHKGHEGTRRKCPPYENPFDFADILPKFANHKGPKEHEGKEHLRFSCSLVVSGFRTRPGAELTTKDTKLHEGRLVCGFGCLCDNRGHMLD